MQPDPLRLGLLSTARISRKIVAAASASGMVEVVAVASRDRARSEAYAREHGIPRAHGSYEALLSDPDVHAVYVPLPNALHHEWAMRSLSAGKHVLCEKPYSRRPTEVEEAFAAAAEAGLVLMEGFMYRHHPQMGRVSRLVSDGAIGRLRAIRAAFTFRLVDQGDVRLRPELDGGALMDVGCYCVSGARLLGGEPEHAQGEHVLGPTGIDLSFHGLLGHPGDVVSQLHASFSLPRSQRLEAVGEEGTLVVEAPWRADWGGAVLLRRGDEVEHVDVPTADSYRLQLENFAAAIAGSAPALLGRDDALGQARTIDALHRAAGDGRTVEL